MIHQASQCAEILRIADIDRHGLFCSVIGRVHRGPTGAELRDWSGSVSLRLEPGVASPSDLSLLRVKGRWSDGGFQVDECSLLSEPPQEPAVHQLQKLGGPERVLFRPELRRIMGARTKLLSFTRRYFDDRGYVEVVTPALMQESTCDPNIAIFETSYAPMAGAGRPGTLYLQTSPELALKRALVSGAKAIYSAGPVFRNGEADATHRPEFLMLEWYQVGATLQHLMDETEGFVRAIFEEATKLGFQPTPELPENFERCRLQGLFKEATGTDLFQSFDPQDLMRSLEAQGFGPYPRDADYEEVFHQTLVEGVQDTLDSKSACFIYDYPAPLALLSRIDPENPGVARRVEAYLGSVEIANGFEELTDAAEYRRRFASDREVRARRGLSVPPMPEAFLESIACGFPPCAGIAVGLDRLIQLACGLSDIGETTAFVVPE